MYFYFYRLFCINTIALYFTTYFFRGNFLDIFQRIRHGGTEQQSLTLLREGSKDCLKLKITCGHISHC